MAASTFTCNFWCLKTITTLRIALNTRNLAYKMLLTLVHGRLNWLFWSVGCVRFARYCGKMNSPFFSVCSLLLQPAVGVIALATIR